MKRIEKLILITAFSTLLAKQSLGDQKEQKNSKENSHEESIKNLDEKKDSNAEENSQNIGPDKGVSSFDKEKGFTLSEEAKKNFSIQVKVLEGSGPWSVPDSALLFSGNEKNIYRVRDGFFKRIDITIVKKDKKTLTIKSNEIKVGDAIVIQGVGFIRIAEVDVTSDDSGHGH